MELSWVAAISGVALVGVILSDAFLTVLHNDRSGSLASRIEGAIWALAVRLGRRAPRSRRSLLAFAGPVMVVATLVVWFAGYVLGFALIYWPFLGGFRAQPELQPLDFVDALYFSGVTGSVLGFGDITPVAGGLQLLSVIQAGFGFALLTGIVTYLLSIVTGAAERNALAARIRVETAGTEDGVVALVRWIDGELDVSGMHSRMNVLTTGLTELEEKVHQFPLLGIYYRSADPSHDLERMLRATVDLSIAADGLAELEPYRSLTIAGEDLARVSTAIIALVVDGLFDEDLRRSILDPEPTDEDRIYVDRIRRRIQQHADGPTGRAGPPILQLAARARQFLASLDPVTGWSMDPPSPEQSR